MKQVDEANASFRCRSCGRFSVGLQLDIMQAAVRKICIPGIFVGDGAEEDDAPQALAVGLCATCSFYEVQQLICIRPVCRRTIRCSRRRQTPRPLSRDADIQSSTSHRRCGDMNWAHRRCALYYENGPADPSTRSAKAFPSSHHVGIDRRARCRGSRQRLPFERRTALDRDSHREH